MTMFATTRPRRRGLARSTAAAALLLAVGLTLSACGGGQSGDPREIVVAEQSKAGMTTGLYPHLAEELGYFAQEGIKVKNYVNVTKGSDAISGMQSGAVQISHIGADGVAAASKGAAVVGLAAEMDASIWTVASNPQITSWDQLRGKTIALGSTNDITRVVFDQLARSAGLDPARDLTYVALGATPQRIAAVQNGQAAATLATYPPVQIPIASGAVHDLGFAPPGAALPQLMTTDIEASRTWAQANPDVAAGYLRAIKRAVDFVRNPANADQATAMIAKLSDTTPEAVRAGLEKYFYNPAIQNAYFPADLRHAPGVFDATVRAYTELGLMSKPITEGEYMDYSYLEKAGGTAQ
ncbi:ABC transporter substrate-binding protein [Actinomycetospora termitidis]|uniref:ABC transporter substrate-binding protein n=1 Tax=Actinomycetospora termitidis TaxID=3053470 RepID=A0ABT7MG83_9PSEU|nr:ABC transporter substrate-binding protein [Actinomycetospora sp. Odt1-22]MDL5159675.1 ABC transporter substrate-binding protein [Actinomycetospora sp. Odt1-22]